MQEERYDHDADEEWTIEDIFVLRSLAMFIVGCAIIVIYEMYLNYLMDMFKAGLMDFLVFYGVREYKPTVTMIATTIMIGSCLVFLIIAWREKNMEREK